MSELVITRALPDTSLEPVGDGWTVYGRAVPYNVAQTVDDGHGPYLERIARGAFERDAGKGGRWVNLMLGHKGDDGDRYLGRCVELVDQPDGLFAAFRLNRSHPKAEEARSGELTGWSVSAHVYRTVRLVERGREILQREVCGLMHVAATPRPQYAGSGVMVLREHVEVVEGSSAPNRDAAAARYGLDLAQRRSAGAL